MKKVLIAIAVVLVVAIGGLLGAAAMQPDELHVERSATIAAPPEQIMPMFTDLKAWGRWNPWHELDPDMELTYSEPSSGEGATYSWSGNQDAGTGTMTITEIDESSVVYALEFKEPFEDSSTVRIDLEPQGDGSSTKVVWSMDGENNFVGKMFMLFMDFEQMIGADFEKGLDNLAEEVGAA